MINMVTSSTWLWLQHRAYPVFGFKHFVFGTATQKKLALKEETPKTPNFREKMKQGAA